MSFSKLLKESAFNICVALVAFAAVMVFVAT